MGDRIRCLACGHEGDIVEFRVERQREIAKLLIPFAEGLYRHACPKCGHRRYELVDKSEFEKVKK